MGPRGDHGRPDRIPVPDRIESVAEAAPARVPRRQEGAVAGAQRGSVRHGRRAGEHLRRSPRASSEGAGRDRRDRAARVHSRGRRPAPREEPVDGEDVRIPRASGPEGRHGGSTMIDEGRLLERAAGTVSPPEHVMDGLQRRRERSLRNRRLGALVLAACLTVAVVVGMVQAIREANMERPAWQPITPRNVGTLQQIGADTTFPQQGFRIATGGGILAMGTSKFQSDSGELVAYPFPCAGTGDPCTPLWRAPIDGPGMPTIADGSVFVTGRQGHTLYAFPSGCASDGSVCEPSWTASLRGASTDQPPLAITN